MKTHIYIRVPFFILVIIADMPTLRQVLTIKFAFNFWPKAQPFYFILNSELPGISIEKMSNCDVGIDKNLYLAKFEGI